MVLIHQHDARRRWRKRHHRYEGGNISLSGNLTGTGSLTKIGAGILTLSGSNIYSGNTTVDGGTLQVPSGSLTSPLQYVGYSATGTLLQSGGVNALAGSNTLYVAYNPGSSGTYNLSGSGLLSARVQYIGWYGSGSFTQSGGTNSVSPGSTVVLGYNVGSSGTYNLTGSGLLFTAIEDLGDVGTGSVTQSGGTNLVTDAIILGSNLSSSGTYTLSGSGLLSAVTEEIGIDGTGSFTQSGGTNSVSNAMTIGYGYFDSVSGSGTYSLNGNGLLAVANEYIGVSGVGNFTQSGGTHSVGSLILAESASSAGTYNLNGGLLALSAGGLSQGSGTATFNFGGGTLGANAAWSSSLNMNMSGVGGPGTVDSTGGNIGLSGNLTGTGGLARSARDLDADRFEHLFGQHGGHGGTLQIPSGSLASPIQYVGYSAAGTLLQSGGVNAFSSSGQLYLGYNPGGSGTYNLSGSGLLSASYEYIGFSGTGNFTSRAGSMRLPAVASFTSETTPAAAEHITSVAAV